MRVHRCPKCKDKGRNHGFNLQVMAHVKCVFQQTFPTNYRKETKTLVSLPSAEPTWSGESEMECMECGHTDKAVEFAWAEYFPEDEPLETPATYAS